VCRGVPRHQSGNHNNGNERSDHDGLRRKKANVKSIGQITKSVAISMVLNGLCPVEPTTAPMSADTARVSKTLAMPSFCSFANLMQGILTHESNPPDGTAFDTPRHGI